MFRTLRSKLGMLAVTSLMVSVTFGLGGPAASAPVLAAASALPVLTVTTTVSNDGFTFVDRIAAFRGTVVTFKTTIKNIGTGSAVALQFTDVLDPYTTYRPGSGKFGNATDTTFSAASVLTEGSGGYDYASSSRTVSFNPSFPVTAGGVLTIFFQGISGQAANNVAVNAATVNFADSGGGAYPAVVSGAATVTGVLVPNAPVISSPVDQSVVQGGTTHLAYTVSGQTDGSDTYNLSVVATPSNTTPVLPTLPGGNLITLGGARLAVAANVGDTSIVTQNDGNTSIGSLNGLAAGSVILVAAVPYVIAAGGISKNPAQNTATIAVTTRLTTVAAAGDVVSEQKTVQVDVPSGTVTAGLTGTQTVIMSAASAADTTRTSDQATATVITVNTPGTTTTTVTSSANPSVVGQPVTFTAQVTGTSGNPSGTVAFFDGDPTTGGTAIACTGAGDGQLNQQAQAVCTSAGLSAGSHTVYGVYGGDSGFNGSTSNPLNQLANQIAVTVAGGQTYGATRPSFTPSYITLAGVSVRGSVSCTSVNGATPISPALPAALSYTIDGISCSGLVASGYVFVYTGATFVVTPAPLTVTASSTTVTFGDAVPVISPSYSGFVGTDSSSAVSVAPACTTTYITSSPVTGSPYSTSCSGAVAPNYTPSYVPGSVTVKPAQLCPTGSYSTLGTAPCTSASAGSYVDTTGATSATLCPTGLFSNANGSISCTFAPPGSYVATTGATVATPCPAGSFSATAGSIACTLAPPGTYVAANGASLAAACPAGSFSATAGSIACTLAPPGSYIGGADATSATLCAAGTYSSTAGMSACTLAAPGSYVAATGATVAVPCPAGSFSATAGSSACTLASPGFYSSGTGGTVAVPCPAGSFSATAGSSACVPAAVGFYVDTVGARNQTACPTGTTTATTGSTTIRACTPIAVAPVFTTYTPPMTATVGQPYSYTFVATGVPAATYTLSGAPSWLIIDPATGLVSGTPPTKTTTFGYTVIAANGVAPNATAGPFTVSVTTPPPPPTRADLSVALSCPVTAKLAATVTCSFTVSNKGPAAARSLVAILELPDGLSPTSISGGTIVGAQTVIWATGTLGANASITVPFTAKAASPGRRTLQAVVGSSAPDPNLRNNFTDTLVTVTR